MSNQDRVHTDRLLRIKNRLMRWLLRAWIVRLTSLMGMENHRKTAELVRKASQKARRPLAILADYVAKMQVGTFANGSIDLIDGESFTFTTEDVRG